MANGIVMNNIAANDFDTGHKNLQAKNLLAKNSLTAQADTAQMNCHVSSVIYKIRDHGPAILDGEFYKDSSNAVLPGKVQTSVAPAAEPATSAPTVSKLPDRGVNRAMLFSILLLTVALASVGFYAYQQKMYVRDLQAELKIYDDMDKKQF
jgi:hypothetical protein